MLLKSKYHKATDKLNIKIDAIILYSCKISHYHDIWVDEQLIWNAHVSQLSKTQDSGLKSIYLTIIYIFSNYI